MNCGGMVVWHLEESRWAAEGDYCHRGSAIVPDRASSPWGASCLSCSLLAVVACATMSLTTLGTRWGMQT
eukprot:2597376-Amphidinium_carterae.7